MWCLFITRKKTYLLRQKKMLHIWKIQVYPWNPKKPHIFQVMTKPWHFHPRWNPVRIFAVHGCFTHGNQDCVNDLSQCQQPENLLVSLFNVVHAASISGCCEKTLAAKWSAASLPRKAHLVIASSVATTFMRSNLDDIDTKSCFMRPSLSTNGSPSIWQTDSTSFMSVVCAAVLNLRSNVICDPLEVTICVWLCSSSKHPPFRTIAAILTALKLDSRFTIQIHFGLLA